MSERQFFDDHNLIHVYTRAQAIADGVARKQRTWQEVYDLAKKDIDETHRIVEQFENDGTIQLFPEEEIRKVVAQVCKEVGA